MLNFLAMAANASSAFTSVLASTKSVGINLSPNIDLVLETLTATSPWTLLFTVFAMCVVYDQSMSPFALRSTEIC